MSLTTRLASTGSGFLDRVLCVVGAVACSQGPEFIQQYQQRLGGHVDEAKRQIVQYENVAQQSGMTLDRFIAQTNANADAAVAKLGGVMNDAVSRLQYLESSQQALSQASAFERPFVFFRTMDSEIAEATWSVFKPAVPATAEGLVYAVVGMVLILTIYHLLFRFPVEKGYQAWRRRRATHTIAST
jgi:hypothetical protein